MADSSFSGHGSSRPGVGEINLLNIRIDSLRKYKPTVEKLWLEGTQEIRPPYKRRNLGSKRVRNFPKVT